MAPRPGLLAQCARLYLTVVFAVLGFLVTETLFDTLIGSSGVKFWRSRDFYWLIGGAVLWAPLYLIARRAMLYLYVFGHELTHAAFVYLCGGRVQEGIRVSDKGGHIVTNKSNVLISLSPYCLPFYSLIVGISFGLAALAVDLSQALPVSLAGVTVSFQLSHLLHGLMGLTWAMHTHLTVKMILKDQPDLRMNGTALSLSIIYLANVALIAVSLIVASRAVSFPSFGRAFSQNVSVWLDRIGGVP